MIYKRPFSIYGILFVITLAIQFNAAAQTGDDSVPIIRGERPPIDLSTVPNDAFEKGIIHIKFKKEFAGHLDSVQVTSAADGTRQFGIAGVDHLNRLFRVRKIKLTLTGRNDRMEFTGKHKAWGFHLWHTLEIDSAADIKKIISEYKKLPQIELAEPEFKKAMVWVPNDPRYTEQWSYHNTGQNGGTAGCDIHLPEAWNIAKGNPNVIVAVIDGGIKYDHPDLAANMWSGIGYNFVNGNSTIIPHDHGTHVAGTIAAINNNGIGVCGVAGGSGSGDGVRLMSCQVFTNTSGGGFAGAFRYAADNGAAIAQNSWGYTSPGVYEQSVLDAIDYFNANGGGAVLGGGITVFAAGNSNSSGSYYPARYSGVIAVAATNKNDKRAFYSNYGRWVGISAPGGEWETVFFQPTSILSTYTSTPDTLYQFLQGTSMACPHVSGVAALVVSYAPGKLSAVELKNILLSSTDNIDAKNPGYVGRLGTGRLNAYKALVAAQPYLTRVSNPIAFNAVLFNSNQINLAWQKNTDNNNVMVAWNSSATFGTPVPGTAYSAGQTITGGGTILYNGSLTNYSHTGLTPTGTYYYKAWSVNGTNQYSTGKTASVEFSGMSRAISITVPGPGIIIYEASGYFYFPNTFWWTTARASLSLSSTVDQNYMSIATGKSSYNLYNPFDVSRAVPVSSAGTYTAFLVGDMIAGSGALMVRSNASATYIKY